MGIDSIYIKNITVFEDINIKFSEGINVIVGENGTGKTTLLKMIYAACEWSNSITHKDKSKSIYNYFNYGKKNIDLLKRTNSNNGISYFNVTSGEDFIDYKVFTDQFANLDKWLDKEIKSIFIPTTEMLSHSKGFLALNQKYDMPFDATQIDIIVNSELPETRQVSELNKKLLECISKVINGTVVYENDTFYILKKNGMKVEFSFEAEGLRKFGLLWKLIRNGLIEKDTVLIWDEPEANINPELIPVLVDILIELKNNGVQIFIATHSYNLAKYFEVKRTKINQVMYHSLYHKNELDENTESNLDIINIFDVKGVQVQSNEYFGKLKKNPIIDADSLLLDKVIEGNFNE